MLFETRRSCFWLLGLIICGAEYVEHPQDLAVETYPAHVQSTSKQTQPSLMNGKMSPETIRIFADYLFSLLKGTGTVVKPRPKPKTDTTSTSSSSTTTTTAAAAPSDYELQTMVADEEAAAVTLDNLTTTFMPNAVVNAPPKTSYDVVQLIANKLELRLRRKKENLANRDSEAKRRPGKGRKNGVSKRKSAGSKVQSPSRAHPRAAPEALPFAAVKAPVKRFGRV